MRVAVVFPGQGSQVPGWGAAWRATPAWSVVERAEARLGRSLSPLLLDADASLARTEDAQLAVLLSALVAWELYRSEIDTPVAFAGHSLGQVTALVAAGVLSFEDGIDLAVRRAALTQAAADARPGRMAALLGATTEQAEQACTAAPDGCWLANDNAPGQIVIAGTPEGVEAGIEAAKAAGVRKAMPLKVGGAFHTPLMTSARDGLVGALAGVVLTDSAIAVVSNEHATAFTDGEGWRTRLADHVVRPVRWRESLLAIAALGATSIIEVGPGEALAGMARRTLPDTDIRTTTTPTLEVPV